MLKLAVLLLIVASSEAAFSCVNTPITTTSPSGYVPPLNTVPVVVPLGTNCTYMFTIPSGYALKLQFSADIKSDADLVTITDNLNKLFYLSGAASPISNALFWVSAGTASINVVGGTGKSTFLAQYTFVSLNTFTQAKKLTTGNFFALKDVQGAQYYTFTSAKNDKVVATVGQRASTTNDSALDQIYVYDGDNIMTAKMIGRLSDLGFSPKAKSSGTALSFVNFYSTVSSTSWVLGNDASTISNLQKYLVIMTSLGTNINANLKDLTTSGSAYTFICTDCSTFYINQLNFDSLGTISNLAYVTYRGMSPTHGMEKLINYTAMAFTNAQLPQKIPTNMITLDIYMSTINVMTSTVNDDTAWKKVVDGRKGYIFSPNLWNPSTTNINYNEEFRNDTQLFTYQVNLNRLNFKNSDSLRVRIGPGSGNPSVDNTYPKVTSSNGVVSAKGNYLNLAFSGSAGSDVRVGFQMTIASSASSIGLLASLALTFLYVL